MENAKRRPADVDDQEVMAGAQPVRRSLVAKVVPEVTAVVVIDFQNDFVADGGFASKVGWSTVHSQRAAPKLLDLIGRARLMSIPVMFVQSVYAEKDISPVMKDRNIRAGLELPRCLPDTWGVDFYHVEPQDNDDVVRKHRYSALIKTDLHDLLVRRGIETVILTGVYTDICVEATARDAYCLDYYVVIAEDCCGATDEEAHEASLQRCSRDLGLVVTSQEVQEAWELSSESLSP